LRSCHCPVMSLGLPAPEHAPLVLAGVAPHARLLAVGQGPLQARGTDRAARAYLFGLGDLSLGRAGVPDREEQVGIEAAARGIVTPVLVSARGGAGGRCPSVSHGMTSGLPRLAPGQLRPAALRNPAATVA